MVICHVLVQTPVYRCGQIHSGSHMALDFAAISDHAHGSELRHIGGREDKEHMFLWVRTRQPLGFNTNHSPREVAQSVSQKYILEALAQQHRQHKAYNKISRLKKEHSQ